MFNVTGFGTYSLTGLTPGRQYFFRIKAIDRPLFTDPQFAGDPGVKGNPLDKSGFSPDRMMDATFKADFDAFFATNPELTRRGIGLQPEAFRDFHFTKPATATQP